jgi:hypothetical protein
MLKKPNPVLLLTLMMILALNACSPFAIAGSSGEAPEPVTGTEPAVVPEMEAGQPASVSGDISPTVGYSPVAIDDVEVEVGVGSPIPVFVHIGGSLPDTCAQVEYVEQIQDGSNFIIKIGTNPSTAQDCIRDSLPFRMTVPLNILDLPVGSYTVEVNGSRAEFKVDSSASTGSLRTKEMPIYKDDVQVDDVSIQVGVGSPIPVHAVVSANLPKSCGQLGEVHLYRAENTFFVRLTGHLPAHSECNPHALPLRLEIPLNIVNLPEGTYEVNVNGAVTTFDIPLQ